MTPRHVWITGASSGIGAALARAYNGAGSTVTITARGEQALARVRGQCRTPEQVHIAPGDLTASGDLDRIIGSLDAPGTMPDLVILNAGTYQPMPLDELDVGAARALFEINFFAVLDTIARLTPRLAAAGGGHLAVVGSVAGDVGLPYAGPYSASKSALNRLCESLRPELEQKSIRLSTVSPGFVRTPLTDKNDFPMPFIIDAERAADIIMRRLARGQLSLRFPFAMSLAMGALALLPRRLLLSVTRGMLKS